MTAPAWLGAMTPEIRRVVRLDDDRAVVAVDLHGIQLQTIYVVGLAHGSPRVSWPCSARGFPIVAIPHAETRERIERAILDAVEAHGMPPSIAKPKQRRKAGAK